VPSLTPTPLSLQGLVAEMNSCLWITRLMARNDECSDTNHLCHGCHLDSLQEFLALCTFMVQQPPVGQCHLIVKASRSHSDTTHSVGLIWLSDQRVSETLPYNTEQSLPCPRWDSGPQSQKEKGCKPTP
jgi:hypothetical protein